MVWIWRIILPGYSRSRWDLAPTLVDVYDLFVSPNGLALFVGKRGILSGDKSFRSWLKLSRKSPHWKANFEAQYSLIARTIAHIITYNWAQKGGWYNAILLLAWGVLAFFERFFCVGKDHRKWAMFSNVNSGWDVGFVVNAAFLQLDHEIWQQKWFSFSQGCLCRKTKSYLPQNQRGFLILTYRNDLNFPERIILVCIK